jgi:hypothetical protein
MENGRKVKKSLQWGSLSIALYKVEDTTVRPDMSLDNIQAFDSKGNLIWTVEPPQSSRDFYYNIKIDADNKILLSYTALSYLAKINLETGRVLDFQMIK